MRVAEPPTVVADRGGADHGIWHRGGGTPFATVTAVVYGPTSSTMTSAAPTTWKLNVSWSAANGWACSKFVTADDFGVKRTIRAPDLSRVALVQASERLALVSSIGAAANTPLATAGQSAGAASCPPSPSTSTSVCFWPSQQVGVVTRRSRGEGGLSGNEQRQRLNRSGLPRIPSDG
jgi:hypothetical protein